MRNILFIFLIFSHISLAQDLSGDLWVFFNHNYIDFKQLPPKVDLVIPYPFYETGFNGATICNKYGKLMFQTGGCYIANRNFDIMKNGDSINSNYTYRGWCFFMKGDGNFPLIQSNIALPYPRKDSFYLAFNLDFAGLIDTVVPIPNHLYYHIIDMRQDSGLGAVIEKKKIAIQDTLGRGHLAVTKHANGRDWWIIAEKYLSNCIFSVQLTPNGVQPPVKTCVGNTTEELDLGSQAAVSPDGKKYARTFSTDSTFIYDFDNAAGTFSNQIKLIGVADGMYGNFQGCVFSPNSRFLYITRLYKIFQFDMQAKDIQASRVLLADYTDSLHTLDKSNFFSCHLGPDGKIYIASFGTHLFISTINRPNCPGKLCDFRAYSVQLVYYNADALSTTAYFETPPANYNCDSLSTGTAEIVQDISIYPNPATNVINVSSTYVFQKYEITNVTGSIVLKGTMNSKSEIPLSGLPDGLYFLSLTNDETQARALGKFVVKK